MLEESCAPETHIQALLQSLAETRESECDCEAVYRVMDEMAELVVRGVDVSGMMPDFEHHLTLCHCCRSEWETLLAIIHGSQNPA